MAVTVEQVRLALVAPQFQDLAQAVQVADRAVMKASLEVQDAKF
jgi:hypothetical protein